MAKTFGGQQENLPDGWTFIGEGCYRYVYLGPDSVVYKVQQCAKDYCNESEFNNYTSKAHLIYSESQGKCRLAHSQYYADSGVIAMEYVPKARAAYWHGPNDDDFLAAPVDHATFELVRLFRKHNLWDIHMFNIWYDKDDVLVMIDYAA